MPLFFLGPFSFRTPGGGGRTTVFGASLLTIPLVLATNEYLDHRKSKKEKTREKEEEGKERRSG